jgi:hypothetical protein
MSDELEPLRRLGDDVTISDGARGEARAALLTQIAAGEAPRAVPRRRRRRLHVNGGALTAIASAAVALAVVAVVVAAGGRSAGHAASPVPLAARPLAQILAPLRRPQTKADLNPALLRELGPRPGRAGELIGTPDFALVRLAAVTPWGEKVYLVPFREPTRQSLAKLPPRLRRVATARLRRTGGADVLGVYSDGDGGCCSTAHGIARSGSGGQSSGGAGTATHLVVVIPDGVAKVTDVFPRQGIPGDPAYGHTLAVTAIVHNNVAAFSVDRYIDDVGTNYMIWYGPSGHVIKRIGDFRKLNQVIPPPTPAPATPLSRAAQHNPATPNPVSVTPRIGGPHTTFTVRFRLLLNQAFYEFRFSGPGGPGCHGRTPQGSDGSIGGGRKDIRGQIFSEPFQPESGAGPSVTSWCPGTFHVSVSAVGGAGTPPGRSFGSFGTATFTVRRG